jgi:large repetitive protein
MVSYQNNTNAATATSSASHTGSTNYLGSSDQKYFTIDKAILQITWSNPQAIDYGTALSSTQVNAEANVLGSFAYNPLLLARSSCLAPRR